MMMENSNTTDEIQSENETTEEILNQNIYYTSKLLIQTNPTKALECFKEIYNKIDGKNNMKFKILKQMLKSSKENFSENIKIFEEILSYYNGSTTRLKFERLVTGWLNSFYNLSFPDELLPYCLKIQLLVPFGMYFGIDIITHMSLCEIYFRNMNLTEFQKIEPLLKNECHTQNHSQFDDLKNIFRYKLMRMNVDFHLREFNYIAIKKISLTSFEGGQRDISQKLTALGFEVLAFLSIFEREFLETREKFMQAYDLYDCEESEFRKINIVKYITVLHCLCRKNEDAEYPSELKIYREKKEMINLLQLLNALTVNDGKDHYLLADAYSKNDPDVFFCKFIEHAMDYQRILKITKVDRMRGWTFQDLADELCCNVDKVEGILIRAYYSENSDLLIDQIRRVVIFDTNSLNDFYSMAH